MLFLIRPFLFYNGSKPLSSAIQTTTLLFYQFDIKFLGASIALQP